MHEHKSNDTQTPEAGSTRREFFTNACRVASIAALGGAVGSLLQSCGGGGGGPTSPSNLQALPTLNGNEANGAITLAIGGSSPLAAVGSAALLQSSAGSLVLVAHTAADTFSALSAICTHQACTINAFAGQSFVCPCHGSQFNLTGQVLSGPAFVALRQYHTQFAGGVLTITP